MLQFLFDTDHLTLFQHQHPPLMQRIALHPAGSVAICPINIEEIMRGRLSLRDYLRSLRRPFESAVFATDDPVPGLLEMPTLIYLFFRRLFLRSGGS